MEYKKEPKEFVLQILREIKEKKDGSITEESLLSDLQLEDIDYSELAILCEEEYSIILDEEIIQRCNTIGEIISYISGQVKEQA